MSENSEDNKNLGPAWTQGTKEPVEKYNAEALSANQNVAWYKLGGKPLDAIKTIYGLNENKYLDGQTTDQAQKQSVFTQEQTLELYSTLGQHFVVVRNDAMFGRSAHTPEIYASPFPSEANDFYMMCPIGDGRKDKKTQFTPEDSQTLSEEEAEKLMSALFNPWAQHMPILRKDPILLAEPQVIEANAQQEPHFLKHD